MRFGPIRLLNDLSPNTVPATSIRASIKPVPKDPFLLVIDSKPLVVALKFKSKFEVFISNPRKPELKLICGTNGKSSPRVKDTVNIRADIIPLLSHPITKILLTRFLLQLLQLMAYQAEWDMLEFLQQFPRPSLSMYQDKEM